MNADLLAMLGGAGALPTNTNNANANRRNDGKIILTIKAGRMDHVLQPNGKYMVSPNLRRGEINLLWQAQQSPSFSSTTTTGGNSSNNSSNNNANSGVLKFEWRDRSNTQSTDHEATIFSEDRYTYTKVTTGQRDDRVYLFQYDGNSSNADNSSNRGSNSSENRRHFFWMQDKERDKDDEVTEKFQRFLSSPAACAAEANGGAVGASSGVGGAATTAPTTERGSRASTSAASTGSGFGSGSGAATSSSLDLNAIQAAAAAAASGSSSTSSSSSALDTAALAQIMQSIGTSGRGTGGVGGTGGTRTSENNAAVASTAGQIDALSNILQGTGMPPPVEEHQALTPSASTPAPSSSQQAGGGRATGGAVGTLTLADLQGAMAGLATSSPTSPPVLQHSGPPLNEVATASAVETSGILNDAATRQRLMELLPEGQKTEDGLRENLRSPQVQQALKSLSSALAGEASSFNEVIANFQLNAEDGEAALASGNPIQAFLDCLVASVQRENGSGGNDNNDGKQDDAMEE